MTEGVGCPGLLASPRAGRAVVFWHGEGADRCAEAWHAPVAVTDDAAGLEVGDDLFQGWRRSGARRVPEDGPSPTAATRGGGGARRFRNRSRKRSRKRSRNRISEAEIRLGRGESRSRSGRREGFDRSPTTRTTARWRRSWRGVSSATSRSTAGRRRRTTSRSPLERRGRRGESVGDGRWLALAALSGGGAHGATEGHSKGAKYKGCCLVDSASSRRLARREQPTAADVSRARRRADVVLRGPTQP